MPTTTKLPMSERPLILDADLAAAVERLLMPLNGKVLEKAQAAVQREAQGGFQGTFDEQIANYAKAIREATRKEIADG